MAIMKNSISKQNANTYNNMDDYSETTPTQGDFGSTIPELDGFDSFPLSPTVPEQANSFTQEGLYHTDVDDFGATTPQPIDGINTGADPVVGWLVCVKGPEMGRDYRLHSGTNFIGRSKRMDVCIENDTAISREAAASISYDDRSRGFFIQKGEVLNLIYLNGKALRSDADLNIYDRIEIGNTMLVFVPLCGQQFNWQEV